MRRILLLPAVMAMAIWSGSLLAADSGGLEEGRNLEKAGKSAEALAVYQRALERGANRELGIAAGALCGKMKRYELGINLLQPCLEAAPRDVGLLNLVALLHSKNGQAAEAARRWEQVLAIDPGNATARQWLEKTKKAPPPLPDAPASDALRPADGTESTAAGEGPFPEDRQEAVAQKLLAELGNISPTEIEEYRSRYNTIVRRCPKATAMPDVCWKLSTLYLIGDVPPRPDEAKPLLERLWRDHPASKWAPFAANRLVSIYRDASAWEDLMKLSQEAAGRLTLSEDEKACWQCGLAQALLGLGRQAEAAELLESVRSQAQKTPAAADIADSLLASLDLSGKEPQK
ncbi:hypothetical protein KBA41_00650 [Candidatus Ozemobacteraceae bacterium]|nr:hypothetical protein [Candidatus Ozemobacteraceae bacterium]